MQQWIADITSRLEIQLDEKQSSQLMAYVRLLREWNERINLTAILDDEGIAIRHLLDSLTLLPMLGSGHTLIDVDTGAGFPGLPLKIVQPDLQVTLLDSLAKRVKFLDAVISELQLSGIKARHGRAEEAARLPLL
ncbi:MAG TPA: 16S rRNA (guanine(527)-N(7))-methyltransferase RsmG, partial [Clostridiales bacterium]|nr:16S rRNA (guanine(527)-N(7))-methyltransferase RsmG [Clostridiales bacterium]